MKFEKWGAFRAISLLWFGSLFSAGCAFLSQVILARQLGPSDFGRFSSALVTVNLFTPLAGFGLAQVLLKFYGEEGLDAVRWQRPALLSALKSTFLIIFVCLLWSFLGPHQAGNRDLVVILSVCIAGQVIVDLASSRLQIQSAYARLALLQALPNLGRLLACILIFSILGLQSVLYAAISYSLIFLAILIFFTPYIIRVIFEKRPKDVGAQSQSLLIKAAMPFGFAGLFHLVYFQSNIILLSYLVSESAAGIYNVAFSIIAASMLLPNAIFQKYLLPKIHRWANHDKEQLAIAYRLGNRAMFVIGALGAVVLYFISPIVISIVFGDKYAGAIPALKVLSLALPPIFLAFSTGAILVSGGNMKIKVRLMGFTAIANIALNCLLIPYYGVYGAAIATIFSYSLLSALYYRRATSFMKLNSATQLN